jgi:hypothetical protein
MREKHRESPKQFKNYYLTTMLDSSEAGLARGVEKE